MSSIFKKVGEGIGGIFQSDEASDAKPDDQSQEQHHHRHHHHHLDHIKNRFHSFQPQTTGEAKWYVDGCSYFWAVSEAIEAAQESIYILDWWLSPELYLRRPPSKNEQYRLDNMLKAAAERGVKIHVIVYKEVEAALTLNSSHTRHHLEALHPNIGVFRHPDHTLTDHGLQSDLVQAFRSLKVSIFEQAKATGDQLKGLYGTTHDDIVLFWAHHEKLCVIDRKVAFMGGLDACFGRWDTSSHPIADVHPGNVDDIIFPGQDYNNARVYDFANVDNWEQNQLDRTKSSRMGWTDVSLSLQGPIVQSLVEHFTGRWNYIHGEKYRVKDGDKYRAFSDLPPPLPEGEERHHMSKFLGDIQEPLKAGMHKWMGGDDGTAGDGAMGGGTKIQLCQSCTGWSAGQGTEHSIANAYIDIITNAKHFVYIENQFFITATHDDQDPVKNKIGLAMVKRILRAHENGEDFKIIVMMPAVPAFAGDLKADDALGTRAIMEFQYNSISRGGHSIIETLREEGIEDVSKYIGFYNLRNYDRINTSSVMKDAEREAGVSYEGARREHDDAVGAGNEESGEARGQYERFQAAAAKIADHTWDSVTACYMDGGPPLSEVPWQGEPEAEMDAFVSEELYIHSKLLIADDRIVICGSANLNDRSQLGTHDSEIAVVIEDSTPVESQMNGEPYVASKFAASLRRYIFRKHLGLLPDQRCDQPDANWTPVSHGLNDYDWDSAADSLVTDPMHRNFHNLWTATARANTEVFTKVFHNVPNDKVRTWRDYDEFFSRHFIIPGKEDQDKEGKVEYGHVVKEEFPGGVDEVKEWLGRVRGSLVEMPLDFLVDVDDIAKEGLTLNTFTDELYT